MENIHCQHEKNDAVSDILPEGHDHKPIDGEQGNDKASGPQDRPGNSQALQNSKGPAYRRAQGDYLGYRYAGRREVNSRDQPHRQGMKNRMPVLEVPVQDLFPLINGVRAHGTRPEREKIKQPDTKCRHGKPEPGPARCIPGLNDGHLAGDKPEGKNKEAGPNHDG